MSGAIDTTSILSMRRANGSVLVTTTFSIDDFSSRSNAGPLKTPCVVGRDHRTSAPLLEELSRSNDCASGVDHVVDQHTGLTGDVADNLFGLDDVLLVVQAALVHDRQVGIELLGVPFGNLHSARVRRNDHQVLAELAQGIA